MRRYTSEPRRTTSATSKLQLKMRAATQPAIDFLAAATPEVWFEAAAQNVPLLLIDHANCEKKAASTALGLLYRYVDQPELLSTMSRLAREELRHFEQVVELMASEAVVYTQLSSSRYAGRLHAMVAKREPQRLIDVLIIGAIVEARSCERFIGLADVLPEGIAQLYRQLVHSEARHFADYLRLASEAARRMGWDDDGFETRVEEFLACDAELVTTADVEFRFHSGLPVGLGDTKAL